MNEANFPFSKRRRVRAGLNVMARVGSGQVRSGQVRSGQVRSGKSRSLHILVSHSVGLFESLFMFMLCRGYR